MVLLLLAILCAVGAKASLPSFDAVIPRQTGSSGGCETYVVQTGDTCKSIARASNSTYAQIVSWNYGVTSLCSNLANLTDTSICISNPFGNYAIPTNSVGQTTIARTAAPVPTDHEVPGGTNTACGKYHLVVDGDDCATITTEFGISLADFRFLNTQIWENCTNLWLNAYYCVEPVGYITTYPGYGGTPTREPIEPIKATWLPDIGDILANYTQTQPIIPMANQTRVDCGSYIWFDNLTDNAAADCWSLAQVRGITAEEFILWNPSLGTHDSGVSSNDYAYPCTVSASTSYCIGLATTTSSAAALPTAQPPSPRAAGEIANCTAWYAPQSYDTCEGILIVFSLSIDVLYAMNPSIGDDCRGMSLGTYYCISTYPEGAPAGIYGGGGGGDPSTSIGTTAPTVTTTVPPSTTTAGGVPTPSPVQDGIAPNCNKYYFVQADDGCWAISNTYSISLDDFYTWNPAVGTDCRGLQAKVYVCIGVSS
ncbi:hypothetical protein DHEL01_v208910 [Diaporthe helianthi]|uniref:LysM domain-containing protein n=1 Tax=Diaporthe helianthi TaxID=158607 RepID=A0A2P5HR14_DIAHE|nr:hypothetical protein DHEL01_v208910 [Diaporthe helianthi]